MTDLVHAFWWTLPAALAASLSYFLTPLVALMALRVGAVDMPGERKIHASPIPRLGGVAVVGSILFVAGVLYLTSPERWALEPSAFLGLCLGGLPILLVSLLDDLRGVGARAKFMAHAVGALTAVHYGISLGTVVHLFGAPIELGWVALPLSVLWIVGVTNAFNIIDGLDGLSAGLALISALSMAAVFALIGDLGMAGLVLVIAGALAGFLPYNVYPARLFLGDTGATLIGFGLAAVALKGGSTLSTGFAVLLPVFVLGLPIADTLIAMARRGLGRIETRRGGMFVADRNHIHHRLLALGIDHGRAVLILYGAGVVLAAAALLSVFLTVREAGLFMVALLVAGFVGLHRLGYDEFAFIRRGTVLKVYEIPVVKRGMFIVFVDLVLVLAASYLAAALKADEWSLAAVSKPVLDLATTYAPVTVLVFWWMGMYRGTWRLAGVEDLARACGSTLVATLIGAFVLTLLSGFGYPPSLFAIYGLLGLMMTAGLRASYVVLESKQLQASSTGSPVLIYGAGARGVAAMRELFGNPEAGLKPIGFVDDDVRLRGRVVNGLPVLGASRDLAEILRATPAEAILIAGPVSAERRERAARICRERSVGIFQMNVNVECLAESMPPRVSVTESVPVLTLSEFPVLPIMPAADAVPQAPCPSCASRTLHRSKTRGLYERLRKVHTHRRTFRCHSCGWRGWLEPFEAGVGALSLEPVDVDLAMLDAGIEPPFASGGSDR